jgi:hypothetical protein
MCGRAQNKFFAADGYAYVPFDFRVLIARRE